MKRRYLMGMMVLLLTIFSAAMTPAGGRLFDTARNFSRQFRSFNTARSMNPIERIVLSLMLAS